MATGKRLAATAFVALACQLAGCTNTIVVGRFPLAGQAGIGAPLGTSAAALPASRAAQNPVVDLGGRTGAVVAVAVRLPGLSTLAQTRKTGINLANLVIELVVNQPGDGGLNPEGVPNYPAGAGNGQNDYSAAPLAAAGATYTMPAGDPNKQMHFTNVPAGTYRIKVRAEQAGPLTITQPVPGNGPPGSDRFAVSPNSVTVVGNGAATYNNTAPNSASSPGVTRLEANVQLQDEIGEQTTVFLNVTNGAAIPAITSTEI